MFDRHEKPKPVFGKAKSIDERHADERASSLTLDQRALAEETLGKYLEDDARALKETIKDIDFSIKSRKEAIDAMERGTHGGAVAQYTGTDGFRTPVGQPPSYNIILPQELQGAAIDDIRKTTAFRGIQEHLKQHAPHLEITEGRVDFQDSRLEGQVQGDKGIQSLEIREAEPQRYRLY